MHKKKGCCCFFASGSSRAHTKLKPAVRNQTQGLPDSGGISEQRQPAHSTRDRASDLERNLRIRSLNHNPLTPLLSRTTLMKHINICFHELHTRHQCCNAQVQFVSTLSHRLRCHIEPQTCRTTYRCALAPSRKKRRLEGDLKRKLQQTWANIAYRL